VAGFLRLRCFIGSPSDGSRLPSQQPRGGAWDPGALVDLARKPGQRLQTPACPRAVPSPYRHSDHSMPKAKTAPVDDRALPLLVSSIPQQPTTPP
jgi:hypothetical protein